jgi:hypothetical protein
MTKELMVLLQTVANALKENNATHLIDRIGERDYQIAQVLDVLVLED